MDLMKLFKNLEIENSKWKVIHYRLRTTSQSILKLKNLGL